MLGIHYQTGDHVPRDPAQGATLFRTACDAGNTVGCTNLAQCYERGLSVPRDRRKAATLYRTACTAGDKPACAH